MLGQHRHQVVLGDVVDLGAEAATDVGSDDPHRVLGHAGEGGERRAVLVRRLVGAPDRGAGRAPVGQHHLGLDGRGDAAVVLDVLAQPMRRRRERSVDVGRIGGQRERDVGADVLVERRRALGDRGADRGIDRQRLDVGEDRRRSIDGLTAGLGDDHGVGLTDEADLVLGEQRAFEPGHARRRWQVGDIVGGPHGEHAWHPDRVGGVDRDDPPVGDVAGGEGHVGGAGGGEIVDELSPSGDECGVLLAEHLGADERHARIPHESMIVRRRS